MSSPVENLVQRLNAKRSGKGWKARCPAHNDRTPSLSIDEGEDGCALIHCHAGCDTDDVLAALGMSRRDLFPATYRQPIPKAPAPVKSAEAAPLNAAPAVQPRPLGQLLDAIYEFLRRYVVFSCPEQPTVCALWIVHTLFFELSDYTPYLHIFSAEKRSGKTRLLDCLALLVKEPWRAVSPSEAVLYRRVHRLKPTLLLDEIDAIFSNTGGDRTEYIRSLLNAGFENGAKVPRCVGKGADLSDQDFSVFCPKALSGIGKVLHDTIDDRCLKIELARQARGERVERFRKRKRKVEAAIKGIKDELEALAKQPELKDTLSNAEPALPDELTDRQMDICEPLLAIADVAGGTWPEGARAALIAVCRLEEDQSKGVQLLAAMRDIFDTAGDKVPTREAVERLVAIEEGPWALMFEDALKHDKLSTAAARLAKLLKHYKIKPRTIKLDNGVTAKGYHRSDFESDWKRYLPASPSLSPEAVTTVTTVTCEGQKVTASQKVTGLQDGGVTQIPLVEGQRVTAVTAVTALQGKGKAKVVMIATAAGYESGTEIPCPPTLEEYKNAFPQAWGRYVPTAMPKDELMTGDEPLDALRGKLFWPGGFLMIKNDEGLQPLSRCELCDESVNNEPFWLEHYKDRQVVHCPDCMEMEWWLTGFEVEGGRPYGSWQATPEVRIAERDRAALQKVERRADRREKRLIDEAKLLFNAEVVKE
jgi:hypothetical protein